MPPGESLQITNFVRPDVCESTSGHTDRESASGHTEREILFITEKCFQQYYAKITNFVSILKKSGVNRLIGSKDIAKQVSWSSLPKYFYWSKAFSTSCLHKGRILY